MTGVRLLEIDPADERALRRWWEVCVAASADRPVDAFPAWEVARVLYRRPRADVARTLLLAVDGDRAVGAGFLVRFLLDNTHLAELDVQVRPDARRRGTGRALLAALEERAVADGRTALVATLAAPVGAESPGSRFAAACGYPVASHEETKTVDLTTAPATWGPLDRQVAAGLGGYRVEVFEDRVPERWLDDFCGLLSRFMTEVPTGDLDLEQGRWTPQRVHDHEDRMRETGKAWIGAFGVAPDGCAVGFTELAVVRADPRSAQVGGTLVLPEHRGHRLGLGMKLANHRRLLELFPACRYVETSNAGVNAPMNAVNEAMGYRVVERSLDVQKLVAAGVTAS